MGVEKENICAQDILPLLCTNCWFAVKKKMQFKILVFSLGTPEQENIGDTKIWLIGKMFFS